jgi:hypothetical protein
MKRFEMLGHFLLRPSQESKTTSLKWRTRSLNRLGNRTALGVFAARRDEMRSSGGTS